MTALLQSSTATGLLMTLLRGARLVDLVPALAVMLGANVGTTLIVQVLSFNVSAVAPVLFLVGFARLQRVAARPAPATLAAWRSASASCCSRCISCSTRWRRPRTRRASVRFLPAITGEPVLCVLIAAALTWAAHSSVAVVLLVMSLAYSHFITPVAALALVLGANLGSAINPLLEGSSAATRPAAGCPLGNLINRLVGCRAGAAVPAADRRAVRATSIQIRRGWLPTSTRRSTWRWRWFSSCLLDAVAALLSVAAAGPRKAGRSSAPLYLDETALDTPSVALACAARETLHMGDVVENMLRQAMTALMTNDRKLVAEVSRMDNIVDRLDEAIKLYVTK